MFQRFFKPKKLKKPVDLSQLITDMHSHLLPGIDDGSPDLEISVGLIREMSLLGYRKLITTPHISSDIYPNTPQVINKSFELLKNRLEKEGLNITIEAAAEYMLDDGFEKILNRNELITFGQKYILIELPYFQEPPNMLEIFFELQIKGYRIMLAHPERYLFWYNNIEKYSDLKNRGIYFQLNMNSLTGQFSREAKKMAEKLIDAGMIDFLGSDLHNYNYLQLLKNSLYEPYLAKLMMQGEIKNHLL
ncbi:MAG: hypothetical protein EA393_10515 [Bacteroidetes bacterium]|nr:MAG: hypothetical protein EA393_10515 [Bacteroidota bacterium]